MSPLTTTAQIVFIAVALLVTACGQTGPLTLPEEPSRAPNITAEPADLPQAPNTP